jgi:hypothetical protein
MSNLFMEHPLHGAKCAVDKMDVKRSEAEGWTLIQTKPLPEPEEPAFDLLLEDPL